MGSEDLFASMMWSASTGNIICDTFLRFKGLERPAVIVTDLRMVRDRYETRMRIAVSRATSLLRIVAEENALKRDPRLAMFQKG
jgi:hypothetical protein